ncbi:hypothetical protein PR202_ga12664 [Eleusine coracana subsp. coracana]|uniref:DEK C-terminal domain-containing protein n=1 Tax=Eleusine coracana subsp. coracana TaxID=191504 RepID=A0AAV5CCJ9_ELECO|nr:hypothetical protein PR202_ga12664 [Eleusine coracana subsp. coracana]
MSETDAAQGMEEKVVANGGAAPEKKEMATKEVADKTESKDAAVADKNAEEQNKVSENGTDGPKEGDVKMAEAESSKEGDGDLSAAEQLDSGDVRKDAGAKEDNGSKPAEGEDVQMTEAESAKESRHEVDEVKQVVAEDLKRDEDAKEDDSAKTAEGDDIKMAEAGNVNVKNETEDKDGKKNVDQQDELKEKEKGDSADLEESKGKETVSADKQEEHEAEGKGSVDKEVEEAGDKKPNASEKKTEKDGADDQGKDSEMTEQQVSEADKVVEENKEETPKNKKARSARDRSQGKDKKQDGTKSREAKSLLSTPSPYGTDRPQRERKTVERLVEAIEKEPNKNFVVEKGRGTPLKDLPGGKMRAKAKEKLDKCVKDVLLDLCWLFAIPVPKTNVRKEDIVTRLLDFIAEPHIVADSGISDDQGSNSRKRKRGGSSSKTPDRTAKRFGGALTSAKRPKPALSLNSDEDDDDYGSMKSDSEENKDEDPDVGADEQEDEYDYGKEKARKKSSEVKESSGRKKTNRGSGHKTGTPRTISKSPMRKSSTEISKEQESPDDSAKVFSRKRKPSAKDAFTEKETKEKKSSGRKVIKGKGASAEANLPSKDELRKTIIGILKKVDFNTVSFSLDYGKHPEWLMATFSDILRKLDNHYKMDLAPKKEAIKVMIQDELTKLSEADDEEDEDGLDAGEEQQQHQTKELNA